MAPTYTAGQIVNLTKAFGESPRGTKAYIHLVHPDGSVDLQMGDMIVRAVNQQIMAHITTEDPQIPHETHE